LPPLILANVTAVSHLAYYINYAEQKEESAIMCDCTLKWHSMLIFIPNCSLLTVETRFCKIRTLLTLKKQVN